MQRRPVAPGLTFGEVITGVDLATPLTPSTWSAIEACLHERGVLIFKNQSHLLTIPQQMGKSLAKQSAAACCDHGSIKLRHVPYTSKWPHF